LHPRLRRILRRSSRKIRSTYQLIVLMFVILLAVSVLLSMAMRSVNSLREPVSDSGPPT
jgi:hypothetical protein